MQIPPRKRASRRHYVHPLHPMMRIPSSPAELIQTVILALNEPLDQRHPDIDRLCDSLLNSIDQVTGVAVETVVEHDDAPDAPLTPEILTSLDETPGTLLDGSVIEVLVPA